MRPEPPMSGDQFIAGAIRFRFCLLDKDRFKEGVFLIEAARSSMSV
jgi:hypothetical protein